MIATLWRSWRGARRLRATAWCPACQGPPVAGCPNGGAVVFIPAQRVPSVAFGDADGLQ